MKKLLLTMSLSIAAASSAFAGGAGLPNDDVKCRVLGNISCVDARLNLSITLQNVACQGPRFASQYNQLLIADGNSSRLLKPSSYKRFFNTIHDGNLHFGVSGRKSSIAIEQTSAMQNAKFSAKMQNTFLSEYPSEATMECVDQSFDGTLPGQG